jgi:AraC-like DNA-binding protein
MKNIISSLLNQLCIKHNLQEGFSDTNIYDIKLFRITCNEEIMPLLYSRGFIFIGEGMKRGFINDREFINTPDDYLMITSTQPIECETCIYEEHSMVGLYVNLDVLRLSNIVSKYNKIINYDTVINKVIHSVVPNKRTDQINEVFIKILKTLQSDIDSNMLESSLLDELYFRILQDKNGYVLQQLSNQETLFSKISKVIDFIHQNLDKKISIDQMAQLSDLSSSSFHRVFKEVLNDTPVQYIKKVRLTKARELILHQNMKVINASKAVGYDSATQFNREFKRYFKVSPGKVKELGYSKF